MRRDRGRVGGRGIGGARARNRVRQYRLRFGDSRREWMEVRERGQPRCARGQSLFAPERYYRSASSRGGFAALNETCLPLMPATRSGRLRGTSQFPTKGVALQRIQVRTIPV